MQTMQIEILIIKIEGSVLEFKNYNVILYSVEIMLARIM